MSSIFAGVEVFWKEAFTEAVHVCNYGSNHDQLTKRLVHLIADWAWQEGVVHPFAREMIYRTLFEVSRGLQAGSRDLDSYEVFYQRVRHKWIKIIQRHRILYLSLTSNTLYADYFLKAYDAYEEGWSGQHFLRVVAPPGGGQSELRLACQGVRVKLDQEDLTRSWITNWFHEFLNGENGYES